MNLLKYIFRTEYYLNNHYESMEKLIFFNGMIVITTKLLNGDD